MKSCSMIKDGNKNTWILACEAEMKKKKKNSKSLHK